MNRHNRQAILKFVLAAAACLAAASIWSAGLPTDATSQPIAVDDC